MINGIEPPKDAEGREIPLSIETMYFLNGEIARVRFFEYWPHECMWRAVVNGCYTHYATSDLLLSPPDSWEQLEDDMYSAVMSEYLEDPRADVRTLVSRAKALAKRES